MIPWDRTLEAAGVQPVDLEWLCPQGSTSALRDYGVLGAPGWHAPAQAASRAVAALPQPERQRPGAAIGQHSANEQDGRYR